jgi:hypothetical protein
MGRVRGDVFVDISSSIQSPDPECRRTEAGLTAVIFVPLDSGYVDLSRNQLTHDTPGSVRTKAKVDEEIEVAEADTRDTVTPAPGPLLSNPSKNLS